MRSAALAILALVGAVLAIKSEPVPGEPFQNGLRKLVGDNFDQIVKDETKDVLIFFYAPWCGHCKKFKPTVEEFGRLVHGEPENKSVVISALDATANDWDRKAFPVSGYPTLYLAKKDGKTSPIKYSNPRTIDGLSNFFKDNGVSLVLPTASDL